MEGDLTKELSYELDYEKKEKLIRVNLDFEGKLGGVGLYVYLKAEDVLDMLAEKIPGSVDDAVIAMIKAAL